MGKAVGRAWNLCLVFLAPYQCHRQIWRPSCRPRCPGFRLPCRRPASGRRCRLRCRPRCTIRITRCRRRRRPPKAWSRRRRAQCRCGCQNPPRWRRGPECSRWASIIRARTPTASAPSPQDPLVLNDHPNYRVLEVVKKINDTFFE